jgi:hypothetical protein
MRIKITAEVDVPDIWCSMEYPEEVDWFMNHVLRDELLLHSNLVGDTIGVLDNVHAEVMSNDC